ncbi:MAG: alpha-amylase family glycosyl hydrolase, partial [Verrucomicrobiales bacterium]
YKYSLTNGERTLARNDPRARRLTNSIGNSIVYADDFDWGDDDFKMPPWNELVIYELHIGTFARSDKDKPGTFDDAINRLDYLRACGINAVEIMPVSEFAGDLSWGYNAAYPFSVESVYGGPDAMKRFVRAAHAKGIAVILDVVYNHFGPSDLDMWQFDGWIPEGGDTGGIYFFNDHRRVTPWGNTRPDYGRGEVRQYIRDNALMWLEDYRCDGLRYDMTLYIRSISGNGGDDIPEGWSLASWINREIGEKFPNKIVIAEDLRDNQYITMSASQGGANFSSQWDAAFVHPVRAVITAASDEDRDVEKIRNALLHRYEGDAYKRVVYTESHDEVANGNSRITSEVNADDPEGYYALKRSTLGAGIVLTAPGIPMLFQGQTSMEDGWFQDTDPVDWDNVRKFPGVSRLYHDLIKLRLNKDGFSRGLTGQEIFVHHVNNNTKIVAYHRHYHGGPGDHVLIVANFSANGHKNYRIGAPATGLWKARFNSDWAGYREDLGDFSVSDTDAVAQPYDDQPASTVIDI